MLNAQTLNLTAFIFEERSKLVDGELALMKEIAKLQGAINLARPARRDHERLVAARSRSGALRQSTRSGRRRGAPALIW